MFIPLSGSYKQNYFKKMDLYGKIKQKKKTPFQIIAEKVGVTDEYVRQILKGKRDGTKHRDGKGKQIIELAEQLIKE